VKPALLVLLLFAVTAVAEEDPALEAAAVLDAQIAAWNRGDLAAFCAVYAQDAVFATPDGLRRGRDEVLARYRKRYPDKSAMGTLSFETQDVRAGHDFVSIVARWRLAYPDRPEATGLTLVVLRRTAGGWQLVQDASM
jgi:uncharacterized protein (TIGR02246 family)